MSTDEGFAAVLLSVRQAPVSFETVQKLPWAWLRSWGFRATSWTLPSNTVIFLCTLGVTLDRTLSYKQHIEKVKGKVRTRNNLLHKLANSSWGANTSTLRATALALCYSVAEYACPVWERSSHAKKLTPPLMTAADASLGACDPTIVDSLYVLAGTRPTWRSQIGSQQD